MVAKISSRKTFPVTSDIRCPECGSNNYAASYKYEIIYKDGIIRYWTEHDAIGFKCSICGKDFLDL